MSKEVETQGERIRKASRHRRDQEKEELRQTILKVAGELFLEQGYDRFSMRRLAERIGYSVATPYLYFRDKDDLLFTVVDEGFVRFKRQLEAAAASSDDPWLRMQALGQAYIDFGLHNPVYYQLMFMWRVDFLLQPPPGEDSPRMEAFRVLQDTVQYAMAAGAIKRGDAESTGDVLWATMHGIVALAITVPMFDTERVEKMFNLASAMSSTFFSEG